MSLCKTLVLSGAMRLASEAAAAPSLLFSGNFRPPRTRPRRLLIRSCQRQRTSDDDPSPETLESTSEVLQNSPETLKNRSEAVNNAVVESIQSDATKTSLTARIRERSLYAIRTGFIKALTAVSVSRFEASGEEPEPEPGDVAESWLATRTSPQTQQSVIEADLSPPRPNLTSPGFSFSAAGFLFPYHLGVAQCLIDNGFIKESTPLAGSSAGALVSAIIASHVSTSDAMVATKELAADCRENGTAFRLGYALREALEKCLPEDAHIKSSGRIQVAVTQLFRYPNALLVNEFESRKDLIDGLLTSCFIPGYFAPYPITRYRKRFCVDGGLTSFIPPTSAKATVRICAFSAAQLGLRGVGISPDCNPTRPRFAARQLLDWALQPASDDILDNFFNIGYQDTSLWVDQYKTQDCKASV